MNEQQSATRIFKPHGHRWRLLIVVLAIMVGLPLTAVGLTIGVAMAFARNLPDASELYRPPSEATRIYANSGELIASLYQENRAYLSIEEIPRVVRDAVIAIEDERFFTHHGVDIRGIFRAIWRNLLAREILEGGSTITQQLARTVFLSSERVVSRKMLEMMLAVEIERRFTKEEILERYLNQVYFGQGAYGLEMAARVYFGKGAKDLSLPEGAILAAMIRAPSLHSPFKDLAPMKARQELVLRRMADLAYLSLEESLAAAAQPVQLVTENSAGLIGIRAPYFVSYVLPYLLQRYGEDVVYRGGLRIYTTLDLRMQAEAEKAVRRGIDAATSARLNVTQGALVAIEPDTGYIRAMIGGYDFAQSQFNRAWQAHRQPGSAFKPFVYTTAIASGMAPTKVIVDEPIEYQTPQGLWQPKNYTEEFAGPVTMREAIERSINIPAIKTLEELGPSRVIQYAVRMGITSPLRPDLSLALGTSEVTPLEMGAAFAVLAAQGVRAEPIAVQRVVDRQGKVLEENLPRRTLELSAEIAYVVTDILKGVITRGTGRGAAIGRSAAGKTGTTDDYRNAWFIGYTPYLSTVVWVGNDDNSPMNKVIGATIPARIWASFMKVAVEGTPPDDWQQPAGAVIVTVCGTSGLLATPTCDDPRAEAFVKGTEPTEYLVETPPEAPPTPRSTEIPPPTQSPAYPARSAQEPSVGSPPSAAARSLSLLTVTAPTDGRIVRAPFVIAGKTAPNTTVTITVTVHDDTGTLEVLEAAVPVADDGSFAHTVAPTAAGPGTRYLVIVTAVAVEGNREQVEFTAVESVQRAKRAPWE